jgi:predicted secreted protein
LAESEHCPITWDNAMALVHVAFVVFFVAWGTVLLAVVLTGLSSPSKRMRRDGVLATLLQRTELAPHLRSRVARLGRQTWIAGLVLLLASVVLAVFPYSVVKLVCAM